MVDMANIGWGQTGGVSPQGQVKEVVDKVWSGAKVWEMEDIDRVKVM
jgi:hypothetical protein